MTKLLRQVARVPLAPVIAGLFGLVVAMLVAMTPVWLLERLVSTAGLPALIPAANPPLGATAQALCVVMAGAGTFGLLWVLLTPLQSLVRKQRPQKAKGSRIVAAPPPADSVRMKRPPIFAERELGAPFMSDEAIAGSVLPVESSAQVTVPAASAPAASGPVAPALSTPAPMVDEPLAIAQPSPGRQSPQARMDLIGSEAAVEPANPGLADEMARLESAVRRRRARGLGMRPKAVAEHDRTRSALRGIA